MTLSPRTLGRFTATLVLVASLLLAVYANAPRKRPPPTTAAKGPSSETLLASHEGAGQPFEPLPLDEPKYSIQQGVYRQAGVAEQHHLVVESEGKGRLVLDFAGIPAFVVGASRVVIDTTWEVEEDDVVFTVHGGDPHNAYRRVLGLALEEVTRFHITSFGEESLRLVRASDGEVFRWVRIAEE